MSKYKIPEWIRKYITKECKTVEELLDNYSKTYNARTEEYHDAMLKHHTEDFKKYGYDFISHHDSVTEFAIAILKEN